ncbi:MAG: tRNA lysidine(34) synthetase TilS [Planctomycetota bacterium]
MKSSGYSHASIPIEARRHELVTGLERGLQFECDAGDARPAIIGCSGGADSVALVCGCLVLRHRQAPVIGDFIVAHVHHHLRGDDADAEADSVRTLCERFEVPFCQLDIHPETLSGNLASNARRLRYDALAAVARDHDCPRVLVAHHADDQAETILMAMARGAGLDGLGGMRWRRSLDNDIDLCRPMLRVRRATIESFCRSAGVTWCEDPTNQSPTSRRAIMRHEVLARLEELWPGTIERLVQQADLIDVANDALSEDLDAAFGDASVHAWSRDVHRAASIARSAAALVRSARALMPTVMNDLTSARVREVVYAIRDDDRSPRYFRWPGLTVDVTAREVLLKPGAPEAHLNDASPERDALDKD